MSDQPTQHPVQTPAQDNAPAKKIYEPVTPRQAPIVPQTVAPHPLTVLGNSLFTWVINITVNAVAFAATFALAYKLSLFFVGL